MFSLWHGTPPWDVASPQDCGLFEVHVDSPSIACWATVEENHPSQGGASKFDSIKCGKRRVALSCLIFFVVCPMHSLWMLQTSWNCSMHSLILPSNATMCLQLSCLYNETTICSSLKFNRCRRLTHVSDVIRLQFVVPGLTTKTPKLDSLSGASQPIHPGQMEEQTSLVFHLSVSFSSSWIGILPLVAQYCAIPRDYLSDTPPLRAMGLLVSQHDQLGAIPPLPFLSVSPLESMRSGGAIPPLKRGIAAIRARYPMKTRQMGAIPPSAILSRKGIARYGGYLELGR